MAFNRPTLSEIVNRIESDIKSGLNLATILRRSFEKVISRALGGAAHSLYGYISDGIDQRFSTTQDEAELEKEGALLGVPRTEATFAELNVTFTGTTGNTVTTGTIYQRSDGAQYAVKADVIVPAAGTETGVVVATDAGQDGNVDAASTLTVLSPIAGVESTITVDSTAVEGEDLEDLEAYRDRVIARKQNPPQGGAVHDYIAYATEVAGVTRAWVIPEWLGQGSLAVAFVEDGEDPIFPSAAKIAEVQANINEKKPVTANAVAISPIETPLNPVIQLSPNTAEVQAAVTAELEDMIAREAEVAEAFDPDQVGLQIKFSGTISLSKINEAISIAQGENDHVLVSPTSDVTPAGGGLVSLGTVSFSSL